MARSTGDAPGDVKLYSNLKVELKKDALGVGGGQARRLEGSGEATPWIGQRIRQHRHKSFF